jgi:hypothetical protein
VFKFLCGAAVVVILGAWYVGAVKVTRTPNDVKVTWDASKLPVKADGGKR